MKKQMMQKFQKHRLLGMFALISILLFSLVWGINGEAAGKYMTKVEGKYNSGLGLLQLKVTVDMNKVGDIKAEIGKEAYEFKWSTKYYERSIAGVATGTEVKLAAYDFNSKVIETQIYTVDKSGKLVQKAAAKTVPVTGIKINLVLKVNETASFEGVISPTNATNKLITWSSSDTKVATVDSKGNVKAIKAGSVVITATTKDGAQKASIGVTVK